MNAAVAEVMSEVGHSARYARVVALSKKTEWQIDRDLLRARPFDFSRKFLPDGLTLSHRLPFLSANDARLMSQVQGRTYAYILGWWSVSSARKCSIWVGPRYLAISSRWKAWYASLTKRSSTRNCSAAWRR